MRWIRHYYAEDDLLRYYEIGDDGFARRQIDLEGPDRQPVTAAILDEVLHLWDNGGHEAVVAHEVRYGVIWGQSMAGWEEEFAGVVEIAEEEFERIWAPARQALEQPPAG